MRFPIETYINLFGEPSDVDKFGDRVWEGMFTLLQSHKSRQWIEWDKKDVIYGWFTAPINFSSKNAEKMQESSDELVYPAIFGPIQLGYDGRKI